MNDRLQEECAVAGVMTEQTQAAKLVYLSLYALQHRGQEASGIASYCGESKKFFIHRGLGLVADVYKKRIFNNLKGSVSIGHNRYSTRGGGLIKNVQPLSVVHTVLGSVAVAHNGQITNAAILRNELEGSGSIFQSTSDTEVVVHLLARAKSSDFIDKLVEVKAQLRGAFSMVVMRNDQVYAMRDDFGFRPLVLGKKIQENGTLEWAVVSETCALDLMDFKYVRDVAPGEILQLRLNDEVLSVSTGKEKRSHHCSFEAIYFARPDSRVFNYRVYDQRKALGKKLGQEEPLDLKNLETVVAVPDSGTPMAMGYAHTTGIPLELGLIRNHYVGRTFIEPEQEIRDFGVKLKLNPVLEVIEGKKIVVVDDSIVRGTTSKKIVRMLRQAGAKEVHMRIGSPPIEHSCFYGVDTPNRAQLLAAQKNLQQMADFIECDSLHFLSLEGLQNVLPRQNHCFACFSGNYPEETFSAT